MEINMSSVSASLNERTYSLEEQIHSFKSSSLVWKLGSYPIKCPTKIAADDTLFFYFCLSKEIRLDVSCESSA